MSDRPSELGDLAEMRMQLREALDTLEAIRAGDVDSLVIGPPGQERIYSLSSADHAYRVMVEGMAAGVLTVSSDGIVLYANPEAGAQFGLPAEALLGRHLDSLIEPDGGTATLDLVEARSSRGQGISLLCSDGSRRRVLVRSSAMALDGRQAACLLLVEDPTHHDVPGG